MATTSLSSGLLLNCGCGPFLAPEPWVNIDVHQGDGIAPDVIADLLDGLPYEDGSAERVYLGHVLEHIAWEDVPRGLAEARRVLRPGGEVMAVGPDVHRAIQRYREGFEEWETVVACLESPVSYQAGEWPAAFHRWNCTEDRLAMALREAGFSEVEVLDLTDPEPFDSWPVVSFARWQCAVRAKRRR